MAWPWLSVIGRIFWLLLLPLTTLLGWLLVALGPILHLGNYLLSGMMLPFKLLAKFEVRSQLPLVL
jgi:cobalamin biosynthesis protein CobD/CbiB